MLRYLRLLLELDSYTVETAGSGGEAVQRLQRESLPDVVLLDLQMPDMDGLATLQYLRHFWPDLKVILCSAIDDPEKIRQALLLGAQAYVVKPVRHLYLSAAIERCLASRAPATIAEMPLTPGSGFNRPRAGRD